MNLNIRIGKPEELGIAAKIASKLQPEMYVSEEMLQSFLSKFKKWYLTFVENEDGKVIGYDIRYAISPNTITIHQSGVLPEYLLTGIWRELKLFAHRRTNADGFLIVTSHLQDYSGDAIHLVSELNGKITGYQHNRWAQSGVRNIGSLNFEMPNNIILKKPLRVRKINPSLFSINIFDSQIQPFKKIKFDLFKQQQKYASGYLFVGATTFNIEVDSYFKNKEEEVVTTCILADYIESISLIPIGVSEDRIDIVSSLMAIHMYTCGFRSSICNKDGRIYLHRRYPQGFIKRRKKFSEVEFKYEG